MVCALIPWPCQRVACRTAAGYHQLLARAYRNMLACNHHVVIIAGQITILKLSRQQAELIS